MTRSPLTDWMFSVDRPDLGPAGWGFRVDRRWHGPYGSEAEAGAAREALFRRWQAAAAARGGWCWRSTAVRWVVTVPVGVAVGGAPMRHDPCTRHAPLPTRTDA
jgi:hypothetical protein